MSRTIALTNENTPYASLEPALILDAIESTGLRCSGSLFALNSYENRVYQVGIEEDNPLIAKFYRPHRWSNAAILEEHQFSSELLKREIPVVAPLAILAEQTLYEYQGYRFAVFPRQGGRTLELDNLDHLEWIGRFIGRLHAVGTCQPFKHRLTLDAQSYGAIPYEFLSQNNFIPEELRLHYQQTMTIILQQIALIFQKIGPIRSIRLHGDCHAGNILWRDTGPQIVDLDDCLMGPAIQDLWMLLSGDTEAEKNLQLSTLLDGYQEFYDFNFREVQLIEVFRTLRMIHYSAWLARRWEDPTFPLHFPWFNTPHYWHEQWEHLQDQIALLEQSALNL